MDLGAFRLLRGLNHTSGTDAHPIENGFFFEDDMSF